ncbi:MAG: VWA domain-containing protein [Cyanobacteria bacterium HKST-UBA02]|nr:VWA domain-containing protein [Cyanobacteria bacterium HKST-UBA02]
MFFSPRKKDRSQEQDVQTAGDLSRRWRPPATISVGIVLIIIHCLACCYTGYQASLEPEKITPPDYSLLPPLDWPNRIAGTPSLNQSLNKSVDQFVDAGFLDAMGPTGRLGECPLEHTDVSAQITGSIARVTVKQEFRNSFNETFEAIYQLPLDEHGAVERMVLRTGNRVIEAEIKRREEAEQIYREAVSRGHTAALLNQERPNIFTQRVANIAPHQHIYVETTYVTKLAFADGNYTFSFPTVVGPRFSPSGSASDVPSVPATRGGRDLSIAVGIDSPGTLAGIESRLHEIAVTLDEPHHAHIRLRDLETIPNRDFVLTWRASGEDIESSYFTHRDGKGDGYATITLMPPAHVEAGRVVPRELIFIVDCSGSQEGAPIEKAKDTLLYMLDRLHPEDTFQVIAFSDSVQTLFSKPERIRSGNLLHARAFVRAITADGGTFMLPAVKQACSMPADKKRLRIVTFMTDGYVDNEYEVLSTVRKLRGTSRWFAFGTGNSVNRFLIDAMAREGGGEAEYVLLDSNSREIAENFAKKIAAPILTDVEVSFEGVELLDLCSAGGSQDLWSHRPIRITGRYTRPGTGKVILTGNASGKPYRKEMSLVLPVRNADNRLVETLWARQRVEDLLAQDYLEFQDGGISEKRKIAVTDLGLKHHIMTPYTSLVGVDNMAELMPAARQIVVPQVTPEGTSDILQRYVPPSQGSEQFSGGLVGAPVDPRYGQGSEVGQLADYGYCDVYQGRYTFWGNDIITNLFHNIGHMIGKWITEFINNTVSAVTELLSRMVTSVFLGSEVGGEEWNEFERGATVVATCRLIAEGIRLLTVTALVVLVGVSIYRIFRKTSK